MQSIIQRMAKPRYHIFLSYRREDGKDLARTLKETLVGKDYRVFLDMDELQDGVFDERILEAIEEAPIYMLIMTKHCFDRCHNADDWVRQELEYAIKKGKVIIPINPDRQFVGYPDSMPQYLKDSLKSHQYSAVDTEQLYQESIDKLVTERIRPVLGFRHKALIWAIVLFFVTLVPYMVAYYCVLPKYYIKKGDNILAQDSLSQADTLKAIKYYQYAIDAKNVEGYGRLGTIYYKELLDRRSRYANNDTALMYFRKGAYAGDGYSQTRLALCLKDTWAIGGFKCNADSAFYWAETAYKNNYFEGAATLAEMYREGVGVAKEGKKVIPLPKMLKGQGGYNFSYSGLKTAVINYIHNAEQKGEEICKADVACSFQSAAIDILIDKALEAVKEYGYDTVALCGGVAANGYLRENMLIKAKKAGVKTVIPEKRYCTDNGCMIAAEGYLQYKNGNFADLTLNASANVPLK